MLYRIVAAALAAGMLAAVLITMVQSVTTAPLILKAETYENAGAAATETAEATNTEDDTSAPWAPADGLERFLYSLLANAATGIGFALFMIVGLTFQKSPADAVHGLLWGIAGFAVFTLAPSLGMAPEVPGIPAADLQARQIWWVLAVASAAIGLGCLVFGKATAIKALGIAVMVAPHIWGAPHIGDIESIVPPDLSAQFAATTITVNALFWALTGFFAGAFFYRLNKPQHSPDDGTAIAA